MFTHFLIDNHGSGLLKRLFPLFNCVRNDVYLLYRVQNCLKLVVNDGERDVTVNERGLLFSDVSHNSLRVIGRKTLKGASLLRNL